MAGIASSPQTETGGGPGGCWNPSSSLTSMVVIYSSRAASVNNTKNPRGPASLSSGGQVNISRLKKKDPISGGGMVGGTTGYLCLREKKTPNPLARHPINT